MNNQIKDTILDALAGIDLTESEDEQGWWETSDGVELGETCLKMLLEGITLDKICKVVWDDYVLEINHPSGKVIKVLIPKDGNSIFEGEPYGLNMVCDGHYS